MANIVTIDGIPVYQALVADEGCGMLRISLVDEPAVESNFLAFGRQAHPIKTTQMYSVQDEEKRLVLGVVMRADFPIYRREKQKDGSEMKFYIIYKADCIRQMAEKYLAENRQNLVNLMHEKGTEVDGVQMVQYFIKGKGLSPEGFDDISDGSLFAEFHVTNDDVWDAIKDGTYRGFSLEGIFDLEPEEDKGFVQEVVDALDGIFSRIFKHSKQYENMKMKGLLARLAKALVEMGNITTDKGILAWDGEEELKVGDAVFIQDEDGNRSAAQDGEYTDTDGRVIVVEGGKVSDIREAGAPAPAPATDPAPAAAADEPKTISTDKGVLSYEGELEVGTAVTITDEEGNATPAPDGEYVAEDGRTIVVSDGVITEIKDAAPAQDPAPAPVQEQRMSRVQTAFQETYNEKTNAIYEAIRALGFGYGYIVEAGDEYAIFIVWNDNGEDVYYRFNITEWTEEGTPVLENGIKVVPAFVTPEEKESAEENFRAVTLAKETAEAKVVELTAQVAELSKKPAGKQAHEDFTGGAPGKTGNKGLDRLNELMAK